MHRFSAVGVRILVVVATLLAACGGPAAPKAGTHTTTSAPTTSLPPSTTTTATSPSGPGPGSDWPTYDGTAGRGGISGPSPVYAGAHLDWSSAISADAYAQPVVAGGNVIVADENDDVYSFSAKTGALTWTTSLGAPVDGSTLPCGNIATSGVTGTPVVDTAAGSVWVAAFVTTATGIHHEIFSLDLTSGAILDSRMIDPVGAAPAVEQQRGALLLLDGYVYVPFGGLFGDCGAYHGYVIGIPEKGGSLLSYQVPASRAGGIWSPPGPVAEAGNHIFVATGNSDSSDGSDGGNSVISLSSRLVQQDSFTPSNSGFLNSNDLDLGSISPVLLPRGQIFIAGKQGRGYLLDASHLGGVGGELYSGQVCDSGASGGGVSYGSYIYVSCQDGLYALSVAPQGKPSFHVAWHAGDGVAGPPIVTQGELWYVEADSGHLVVVDPATGQVHADVAIGATVHFTSAASAGSQVFVVGDRKIQAFSGE